MEEQHYRQRYDRTGEQAEMYSVRVWFVFLARETTWGHNVMMEERGEHQRREHATEVAKPQMHYLKASFGEIQSNLCDSADTTICHILLKTSALKGLLPARHLHIRD